MSFLEIIETARQSGDPSPLVQAVPYSRFLGLDAEVQGDEIIGVLRYGDHLVGNSLVSALHGGTLGALLESTAVFTLIMRSETLRIPKTITITVEYLRSAGLRDTCARAEMTRLGRRIASVRAFAWQEDRDKPVAAANAHFLFKPEP